MSSSVFPAIALLFGVLGVQEPDATGLTTADVRLTATAKTRVSVGEFLAVRTIVTAKHRVRLCDRAVGVEVDAGAASRPTPRPSRAGRACSVGRISRRGGASWPSG